MNYDREQWYKERGHLFDKQLISNCNWICQPWWKRLWLRIIGDSMINRNKAILESYRGKEMDGNFLEDVLLKK